MGVEGGGISAGAAVSMGPARGGVGISSGIDALNATVSIGRVSAPLNEGSVAPRFLENIMPITLNRFNPEAKIPPQTVSVANTDLPSGAEAVDIVEKWLGISSQPQNNHYILDREYNEDSQQRVIEPIVRPTDFKWTRPEVLPFYYPEPLVKPKIEPKIHSNTGQIELSKSAPVSGALTELNKKSVQENVVGQIMEEKETLVEEKVKENPEILETEEIEELKLKDLLDEETAQQRVYEIGEAIDLAGQESKKAGMTGIEGWRIIKFLKLHIGLISQIAKKAGKDGSLDEIIEELSAKKFASEKEAKEQVAVQVLEKEPVKRGKEGKGVKEGAVERVFKYHLVKRSPNEEVVTRAVKKQAIPAGNSKEAQVLALEPAGVKEQRIEDTGLAELFQKAA